MGLLKKMFPGLFVNIVILLGFNRIEPLSPVICNQRSSANLLIIRLFTD
jgi:hypothetical protein